MSALVLGGTPGGLLTPKVVQAMADMQTRVAAEGVRSNTALAEDFPEREPAKAFLYEQIRSLNPELTPEAMEGFRSRNVPLTPESFDGYRVPTIVISGEHDPLFPPAALREVADSIPGADFVPVTGVGHSAYWEAPEHFNRMVLDFLGKHA